jgi:superfamily II DNA or RNA helicase
MSDNLIMPDLAVLATLDPKKNISCASPTQPHSDSSRDTALNQSVYRGLGEGLPLFQRTEHPHYAGPVAKPTPKKIELRDYQQRMVGDVYGHIKGRIQRILAVIIMGGGKTYTSAWMIRDAVKRGHRCVFLVALNVLLEQTAESLRDLGVTCTILQGDRKVDPEASVIVASCQTIQARLRRGHRLEDLLGTPKLVVVDEAHNTAYLSVYEAIEDHYLDAGTIFLGLTATPWRLSKKEWLGQKFDALVVGPQPPELIQRGAAVPCRGFTLTGAFDLETLRIRNGDYVDSDISNQACRPEALEHVVREWLRIARTRTTLMVGATVEQAAKTCQQFKRHGIPAEIIVGSTSQDERKAIFERVKAGQTRVICSVGCLTAGFNLPRIDCILYVRATKSKALFHQTAGRGSRPYPGKTDYLLLDFGGNLKRHGNPMGYQVYDISEKLQEENPAPTKTCPECSAEVNIFAQVCPHCGYEFSGDVLQEETDLVLQELNEYVDKFTKRKIKQVREWRKTAYLQNQSPDTAIEQFVSAYGHNPPSEWLLHATLGKRVSQKRKLGYLDYLEKHCKRTRWADQWIRFHLSLEFGTSDLEQLQLFRQWGEVLEVPYSASWAEVKARYLEKIQDLPDGHPDHEVMGLALADAREDFTEAQQVEVAR